MVIQNQAHDGKANTCATIAPCGRMIYLIETLENCVQFILCNPNATILNRNANFVASTLCSDFNNIIAKFEGIIHEQLQNCTESLLICQYGQKIVFQIDPNSF